ncbi:ABC transporter substrate-binding protein [Paenibacillus sp. WQ 127069]|uniref:ABC transporter substrate-binding protein n=1 Tax=Paenibacillus baimaensis TaxID=2982185 RepID=A0ABT2UJW3_9BACL|nr:ABC transporter substrate-binding protein [Paenibacillus sp. WQ 127069]MCU6794321.1 ABC transporter substrate-binding protein [Paenibacillus sp. WQ 127069]
MRLTMKKVSCICVAGLLLLTTACTPKPEASQSPASSGTVNAASSHPDRITIGMTNPPTMFNPIDTDASGSNAATFINRYLYDTLLKMTAPLEFKLQLAESFEQKDSKTYVIKLRKDANWSDGKPVTAQDFEFTANLVAHPKTLTTIRTYINYLDGLNEKGRLPEGVTVLSGVKVIDDKTFELVTANAVDPNMVKERLCDFPIIPKHVFETADPSTLNSHAFWKNPNVTDGPYTFNKFENGVVQLAANSSYYRGTPKIKEVVVKVMPAANMVAQLQSQEIDMNAGQGPGNIPPKEWETIKKMNHVQTTEEPTRRYNSIEINTTKIPDKRVRQAMAYAINREAIVNQLMKGIGEVQNGPYAVSHPYYDKDIKKYSYDPEKAKQLLKEAGWDSSKTLDFIVPTGDAVREMAGNIIQQNLEAVGVKVKQVNFDFATAVQRAVKGDFDLLISSFSTIIDPDGPSNTYKSTAALNDMRYNNPRVDELFALGMKETTKDKRFAIYKELQNVIQEDVPLITIYSEKNLIALNKSVTGRGGTIYGMHYDVNEWTIK